PLWAEPGPSAQHRHPFQEAVTVLDEVREVADDGVAPYEGQVSGFGRRRASDAEEEEGRRQEDEECGRGVDVHFQHHNESPLVVIAGPRKVEKRAG
ncbi:hypothetical protein GW17_00058557, partial [Ensete ventricosum]